MATWKLAQSDASYASRRNAGGARQQKHSVGHPQVPRLGKQGAATEFNGLGDILHQTVPICLESASSIILRILHHVNSCYGSNRVFDVVYWEVTGGTN